MDLKRFTLGTVAGTAVLFATGVVIWGPVFSGFYEANTVIDVNREAPIVWAVVVGNAALAALITLTVVGWARTVSVVGGIVRGGLVAFLVWMGVDFIHYGITNTTTLTVTLVDPLLEFVHGGLAGGVIVLMLSRLTPSENPRI